MKLLLMFGDGAVGKMTVGQELMKITDLRLFHNHMTIEPVLEVFGYFKFDTIEKLRMVFFEDFAESDLYGMIFTFMWAFSEPYDWDYVARITDIFEKHSADIYYVELNAPLDVRLERNSTPNRLLHKPSKRDLDRSNHFLTSAYADRRFVSNPGELQFENYIRIDNTNIAPDAAAKMIKDRFNL